jgi:uncharacterized protein (DUF1697 family)
MTKYVAFLRGINVGGRMIKMNELKACFEDMGFFEVKTLLNSGNVLFESDLNEPELKNKIEAKLTKTFNYPAKVQVLSLSNLTKIVEDCPFEDMDGFHSYIVFLEGNLAAELATEATDLDKKVEQIKLGKSVLYWRVPKGMTLKCKLSKHLGKVKYKDFNTVRNINTLRKAVL